MRTQPTLCVTTSTRFSSIDEPRGYVVVGKGVEHLHQHRFVVGYPLAHSGDPRCELEAHGSALEQQAAGPQRIASRESAVAGENGARDKARKFRRPALRRDRVGRDQRMRDRLRRNEVRRHDAAEQIFGAPDAQARCDRARQRVARHEVGACVVARGRIVLAAVVASEKAGETACDLRSRAGLVPDRRKACAPIAHVNTARVGSARLSAMRPTIPARSSAGAASEHLQRVTHAADASFQIVSGAGEQ